MFSVIIQNKKTIESFNKFYPLFLEHVNNGEIGVCKWIESGTNVDSALPELREMTDEKESWRAIIVHLEDGEAMSQFERSQDNPFDFLMNHENKDYYGESEIPLVRLTHILGGFPTPKINYEAQEIIDSSKASRVIYKPMKNEEHQRIYEEITEKYSYDGKMPEEIVLITLRCREVTHQKLVKEQWTAHKEIQSSEFWAVNHYAAGCRFITYDVKNDGKNEREADMFRLWNAVMLLATNHVNPNELQAYRLYNIRLTISKSKLKKALENNIFKLNGIKQYINGIIQEELNRQLLEKNRLPLYRVDVPVVLEDVRAQDDILIDGDTFHIVPTSNGRDVSNWNALKDASNKKIKRVLHDVEHSLDDSAERLHSASYVRDSEIMYLNKFQKSDMNEELKDLYNLIMAMEKEIPDYKDVDNKKLKDLSSKIMQQLKSRLNSPQIQLMMLILCGLILLSSIPAIAYLFAGTGSVVTLVSIILITIDIIAIVMLVIILKQKFELQGDIDTYNSHLRKIMTNIVNNKDFYARFLSNVATHIKGKAYLQKLAHKNFVLNNVDEMIVRHEKHIDILTQSLYAWGKAFYLDINYNNGYSYEDIDLSIPPKMNVMYTLEHGEKYKVPFNKSGETLDSSVDYITKLDLVREELYDDNNS